MAANYEDRPNQPQAPASHGISPKSESRERLLTLDQRNSSSDLFISISGLIGAGKSTLATKLGERMNLPVFYEPVIDNVYLSDFYKDPARYSFPLQVKSLKLSSACFVWCVLEHFLLLCATGISAQPALSATPADNLDRKRWGPGSNHLWRLCLCQGEFNTWLCLLGVQ